MVARSIRTLLVAATAIGFGASAGPAAAQVSDSNIFTPAPTSASGHWYGSGGVQITRYFMPQIGGYQSQFSSNNVGFFDPAIAPDGRFHFNPSADVTLATGVLTGGYVLSNGTLPPWLGQNVRIQVTGTYGSGNRDIGDINYDTPPFAVQIGLDAVNDNAFVVRPAVSDFTNETSIAGGQLAMVSDMPLGGWILTPSVRFFGSVLRQRFGVNSNEGSAPVIFSDTYSERIRTDRYALGVGLGATRPLGTSWSVTLGGSASGVYTRAHYDGSYCFDNSAGTAGCDGVLGTGIVNTSSNRFGAQLGGLAGLNFMITPRAVVSLNVSVDWFSAAPGTNHPFTTAAGGGTPASIRWDSMTALGGTLRLTIGM